MMRWAGFGDRSSVGGFDSTFLLLLNFNHISKGLFDRIVVMNISHITIAYVFS